MLVFKCSLKCRFWFCNNFAELFYFSCFLAVSLPLWWVVVTFPGLEVIKLEYSLKLKIKRNDWLLADSKLMRFILSLRMNSSFKTSRQVILTFFLAPEYPCRKEKSASIRILKMTFTAPSQRPYSKTCVKRPLTKRPKMVFKTSYR